MRLYLSSFRNGEKTDELLRMLGSGRRTAMIGNAMDMADPVTRAASNKEEMVRLESIGLKPTEIDLRQYFGKKEELRAAFSDFDLMWVRGGNTFVLRRAFKQSGFNDLVKEFLEKDSVVYGGYSAGICLLAPTLRGLEIVDDPNVTPEGYNKEVIWEGLNILPYSIAPHYKSDHPESADIDRTVEYFEANKMPYKTLRDGEVIIIM